MVVGAVAVVALAVGVADAMVVGVADVVALAAGEEDVVREGAVAGAGAVCRRGEA